jgi:hypothetical protein
MKSRVKAQKIIVIIITIIILIIIIIIKIIIIIIIIGLRGDSNEDDAMASGVC